MELFAEAAQALKEEQSEESQILYASALAYQGYFMSWLGLSDQGYELAIKSLKILEGTDHLEAMAFAYESLALNSYCLNKFMDEITGKNKMVQIATQIDDKWLIALANFEASMCALRNEDYEEAMRLAEYSLRLNEEIGNEIRSNLSLLALGHSSLALGNPERARACYQRILQISQEAEFLWGIEKSSKYLGKVALSQNKIAEANEYLIQSLRITNEIGLVRDILNLLYEYACLLVAQGDSESAAELLALILQHPASEQIRLGEGRIKDSVNRLLTKLEDELSPETYSTALKRGQELDIDVVITELINSIQR